VPCDPVALALIVDGHEKFYTADLYKDIVSEEYWDPRRLMVESMHGDLDTIDRSYGYFETEVFPMLDETDIHG
jgi:hypothetical protein